MTQKALSDNPKIDGVLLENAANQLGVSVASVRNWIKTGYLDQISRGVVSQASFDDFIKKVAGGKKLTTRANKSLKDSHKHDELQNKFLCLINSNGIDVSKLGVKYEESLSNSYRNKEGVYYTPPNITNHFFKYISNDSDKLTFCDPCCGSGNFIISAIEFGISPHRIYGYDIDPVAVELTKKRIYKHTSYVTGNIQCIDFLESTLKPIQSSFDVIFTNPPWGKKISKKQKEIYGRALGAGKSIDTSSLFFFACINRLTSGGYLGFLLQDAFFNVATYEQARSKALSLQVMSIIDFGKPFDGLLTKAKGILINNTTPNNENIVTCEDAAVVHERVQSSFSLNPKSILNSNTSQEESDAIAHIYSLPHITLAGRAKWALGIVTGSNKKFVIDKPADGYVAVFKGADIKRNGVKKATAFIPNDLSLYQQVAPKELYQAKEKLIYKFISSSLVFFCDTKQRTILNSANLVIPDNNFPINQIQLSNILNSKVINWLFKSVFDTHKVLRSDIEALPIHAGYFDEYTIFDDSNFANYLGLDELESGTFRINK